MEHGNLYPLGQMLTDGGFISATTLEKAIEKQLDNNERLGTILVNMGVIDKTQLKVALSIQKNLSSLNDAIKIAAGMRQQLGEMLIGTGRITQQQLKEILEEQKNDGNRIGNILVKQGYISERELNALLMFQGYQCINNVYPSPLRLGRLLASMGHVTSAQVGKALKKQSPAGKDIGQVLADSGFIKQGDVFRGLKLQQMLITTVLKAVLSLASAPHGSIAAPNQKNTALNATVERAVPATFRVLNRKRKLTINNADIKRGYVDVNGGVRVEIRAKHTLGCLLSLDVDMGPFQTILVTSSSGSFTVLPDDGSICFPCGKGPLMVELSCRLFFSGMARPGKYTWPLRIRVHAE